MARPPKLFPAYRKHRGSGQAVCTINSRDHYLGLHGSKASRLEYDRLITEWLSSGRSTSYGAPQHDLTIVELCASYLEYAKAYYGAGPRSTYAHMVRVARPLTALYGRTPAAEFGVVQFKALRQSLMAGDRSRSYVNSFMTKTVAIFRWGAAEGLIPAAVVQTLAVIPGLRKGRTSLREPTPVEPVADSIVELTLPHLSPIVADMVRLQKLAGMRPSEACILRPCDLDRSGDVWIYRPGSHKTEHHGKSRVVFIGQRGQAVLLRYLARDAQTHCFRPCDSMAKYLAAKHEARKTSLSCGNKPGSNRRTTPRKSPGERYTTCSYRRAIHNACDKAFMHPTLGDAPEAKLTAAQSAELREWQSEHRWAPNQLRHATATEVRKRFGLEAAQIMLGHAAADVTQVYAERDLAKGLEVARLIG